MVLHTISMCGDGFPTLASNSWTPAGCPTNQLNYDIFQRLRAPFSPTKLSPSPSDTNQNPDCHLCYWPNSYRLKVQGLPFPGPLDSINLLEELT